MSEELKYCKFCDKEKPIKEFCKSGFAIKNICRECQSKKTKKQYRDAKILTELEEYIQQKYDLFKTIRGIDAMAIFIFSGKRETYKEVLDKIQELKEKYK